MNYSFETLRKMASDIERCGICRMHTPRSRLRPVAIDARHEKMGCPVCYQQTDKQIRNQFLELLKGNS